MGVWCFYWMGPHWRRGLPLLSSWRSLRMRPWTDRPPWMDLLRTGLGGADTHLSKITKNIILINTNRAKFTLSCSIWDWTGSTLWPKGFKVRQLFWNPFILFISSEIEHFVKKKSESILLNHLVMNFSLHFQLYGPLHKSNETANARVTFGLDRTLFCYVDNDV